MKIEHTAVNGHALTLADLRILLAQADLVGLAESTPVTSTPKLFSLNGRLSALALDDKDTRRDQ